MNILYLHERIRKDGIGFLRSRYLVEELQERGHAVQLASCITDASRSKWEAGLEHDLIHVDEVLELAPDALVIELGAFSVGNRTHSREFLDKLKERGCIILHCGFDYNEYNQKRKEYDKLYRGFAMGIAHTDDQELPNIRGADGGQEASVAANELQEYSSLRDSSIFEGVSSITSRHALVIQPFQELLLVAGPNSYVKAYNDRNIHGDTNSVFGSYNDYDGIEALITGHFTTDGDDAEYCKDNRTFVVNVLEHFYRFHPSRYLTKSSPDTQTTRVIISYAWTDNTPNTAGVGKIDAIVQALRNRKVLVDRDVEIFRAGHLPLAEWEKRLPDVDKAVFFYTQNWRDRPNPNKELEAAQREADRRFIEQRKSGADVDPFILFFCLEDTPVPDEHSSRLYRALRGMPFPEALEMIYRDIVGATGDAKAYDIATYDDFVF